MSLQNNSTAKSEWASSSRWSHSFDDSISLLPSPGNRKEENEEKQTKQEREERRRRQEENMEERESSNWTTRIQFFEWCGRSTCSHISLIGSLGLEHYEKKKKISFSLIFLVTLTIAFNPTPHVPLPSLNFFLVQLSLEWKKGNGEKRLNERDRRKTIVHEVIHSPSGNWVSDVMEMVFSLPNDQINELHYNIFIMSATQSVSL